MEIEIIVTLQVDSDGKLTKEQLSQAALQAVTHALNFAESSGFVHQFADLASIGVVSIDSGVRDICPHCNTPYSEDSISGGRCSNCGSSIM